MSVTKKFFAVQQGADRRLELEASGHWITFTVEGAVAGAGWTHSDFLGIYPGTITAEAWAALLAEADAAAGSVPLKVEAGVRVETCDGLTGTVRVVEEDDFVYVDGGYTYRIVIERLGHRS